jgi:hypothetical protein
MTHLTSNYQPKLDSSSIRIGQTVRHNGLPFALRGISPASLPERFAELEDGDTRVCFSVPLAEIVADNG